ncbi:uncharacterized protein LOC144341299 [Macaca mulatta]
MPWHPGAPVKKPTVVLKGLSHGGSGGGRRVRRSGRGKLAHSKEETFHQSGCLAGTELLSLEVCRTQMALVRSDAVETAQPWEVISVPTTLPLGKPFPLRASEASPQAGKRIPAVFSSQQSEPRPARVAIQAPGPIPSAGPGPTPSTPSGPALPSHSFPLPPSTAATSARPPEVGPGTAASHIPPIFLPHVPSPSPPPPRERGRCCWSLWPGPRGCREEGGLAVPGVPRAPRKRRPLLQTSDPSSKCAPRFSRTLDPRSRLSFSKFLCSAPPTFSRILPGLGTGLQPPFCPRFSNAGISARPAGLCSAVGCLRSTDGLNIPVTGSVMVAASGLLK